MIRTLEELLQNALPARRELRLEDWRLRFSDAPAALPGAILPAGLAEGDPGLGRRLALCEAVYRSLGAPLRVRLVSGAGDPVRERLLAVQGYRVESEARVFRLELQNLPAPDGDLAETRLSETHAADWCAAYAEALELRAEQAADLSDCIDRVVTRRVFVTLRVGDRPAALCSVALERGACVIAWLAAAPWSRGRGLAREALLSALDWARSHAAQFAVCETPARATAASALLGALGANEVYSARYFANPTAR
jgi:GNAT superfamily N-acetyltransferase